MSPNSPDTMAQTTARRPCRIMPVGDSITAGGPTFCVYRRPLLEKLIAAGHQVVYVGSQTDTTGPTPLRHEAYPGQNAEFIATVAVQSFGQYPADIVLLHAGHNHFADEKPIPGIIAATKSMIEGFRRTNPDVTILLAQVIPAGKLPKYSYIPDLNHQLAALARHLHTPAHPLLLVNQADGFDWTTDTIEDKVHPNARGAARMAEKWFTTLQQVLPTPANP